MDKTDLTYKIIGAAMSVHKSLGPGFLEEVYKNALLVELKSLDLLAETEVPIAVEYKGVRVGTYQADIIVEKRCIIELKAVRKLHICHEAQLVNYLTATGIEDGLLVNFGGEALEWKRKFRVFRTP